MKRLIIVLAPILILLSCNEKKTTFNKEYKNKPKDSVTSTLVCDTILNNNHTFVVCQGEDVNIFILRDNDTVFKNPELTHGFEVTDFNEDGYKDLIFHYVSNNALDEIYLFDKTENKFRYVKYSDSYPESVKIKNTSYYYSYNRRGCSDLNWDSDLFFIKDFEIHKIGNITGVGCPPYKDEETETKNGIYISKFNKDSIKTLIQYIPRESGYYKEKWDLMENYWVKNYKKFE